MNSRRETQLEEVLRQFALEGGVPAADPKGQNLHAQAPPEDQAKRRRRRRIVEVATALFVRHGYRKTSVDDIATEAGIAKGTIYLYFKSKADILVQAAVEEKMRYVSRMRAVLVAELTARERLRRWLEVVIELGSEMPLSARLLGDDRELQNALAEIDSNLIELGYQLRLDFLSQLLAEAAQDLDWDAEEIRERAALVLALYQSCGLFVSERARAGIEVDRFAPLLAGILVDGLFAPTSDADDGEPVGFEGAVIASALSKEGTT